jgi:hypothetical protein
MVYEVESREQSVRKKNNNNNNNNNNNTKTKTAGKNELFNPCVYTAKDERIKKANHIVSQINELRYPSWDDVLTCLCCVVCGGPMREIQEKTISKVCSLKKLRKKRKIIIKGKKKNGEEEKEEERENKLFKLIEKIEAMKKQPFNEKNPYFDYDERDLFSTYKGVDESLNNFATCPVYLCRSRPCSHPPLVGPAVATRLWRLSVIHGFCMGEDVRVVSFFFFLFLFFSF